MKTERVELRVSPAEKAAFEQAASVAGLSLSSWMRVRLRSAAIKDLEDASMPIPFMSVNRG